MKAKIIWYKIIVVEQLYNLIVITEWGANLKLDDELSAFTLLQSDDERFNAPQSF